MATLTTSYQLLSSINMGNWGYGNLILRQYGKLDSQNIANNTSTFTLKLAIYCDGVWCESGNCYADIDGHNIVNNQWIRFNTNSETELGTYTFTNISHNADGTLSLSKTSGFSCYALSGGQTTSTFSLPTIPRYATCQQSLASKTETSITMNWTSDNTIDRVWYSTNGGTSFTLAGDVNATSGSYTMSGLTANTTYSIKTRVRRKDSQLTTDSTVTTEKTYANVTQSLVSKTVNSITMSWSLDTEADKVWYSIGSGWVEIWNGNSKTGTYTITGLTPNREYNVYVRARRKSTQTLSDTLSSPVKVKTYDKAIIKSSSNWTIGNNTSVTYDNPSGASISIGIYNTAGSVAYASYRTPTASPYTFQFTSAENTALYNSIPDDPSGTVRIYLRTTANGISYYDYVDRTITANQSINKPTFSNFTYADVNTNVTALTGNNQILVNGLSNVTVTIPVANKAVAKNGASMDYYRITVGTKVTTVAYSSSANVTATINAVNGANISVEAVDTRGFGTIITKTATWKEYKRPTITGEINRENQIGTKVLFNISGTYWNGDFGYVTNRFRTLYYRYKERTASTWSNWILLTNFITYADGEYSTISGSFLPTTNNGSTPVQFELGKEYNVDFNMVDETEEMNIATPISFIVNSGIPCTDKYKDSNGNHHVGINQLAEADNALAVGGSTNINTNSNETYTGYKQDNTMLLRKNGTDTIVSGALGNIYFRPNGTASQTGQARIGTDGRYYGLLQSIGKFLISSGYGFEMGQLPVYANDLNDLDSTTIVYCNNVTNVPSGAGNGYCVHLVYRTGYMRQFYYSSTTTSNVYTRVKANGTWGTWARNIFTTGGQFTGELSSTGTFNQGSWGAKATGALSQIIDNTHAQHTVITGKDSSGNRHYSMELYDSTETNGRRMRLYTGNNGLQIAESTAVMTFYKGSVYSNFYGEYPLYNNTTGSTGTITLNETSANFTYIDIYFRDATSGANNKGHIKVFSPNRRFCAFKSYI